MSILLIVSYCVLLWHIVTYCLLLPNIAQIIDKPCMVFNEYELSCFIEYHRTTNSNHKHDVIELSNFPTVGVGDIILYYVIAIVTI